MGNQRTFDRRVLASRRESDKGRQRIVKARRRGLLALFRRRETQKGG